MGTPGLPECSSCSEYRLDLWGISVHVMQSDNPKLLNLLCTGPFGVWERAYLGSVFILAPARSGLLGMTTWNKYSSGPYDP